MRFAERESHNIFLEPEGLDDETVYPNGISTSLPAEVIARLARARDEERVADGAERARAAGLGHASAAQSARERIRDLTAGS